MTTLETLHQRVRLWKKDPVAFVVQELHAEPDPWQVEALRVFPDPTKKRMAAKACKGPGKTAFLSWCILNFLTCYGYRGSHPKGAATSITDDNLKDNLWPEIAKWMNRSPFLKKMFMWTKERVFARDHPETWFFSARTWPKSADKQRQADTLAGIHSDCVLFVLDEAGGIPDSVVATAEGGLATGHWNKIVIAGNPTHLSGPLYRACTADAALWTVFEITGDPDDPMRSPRINVQWAREQIQTYGRDNPWVLVNVFGKFPPSSINTLLGPDEVHQAMRRHLTPDMYSWAQKRLGVDVARFGDDRTVLFPRQGLRTLMPVIMRHDSLKDKPSVDIAARVARAHVRWKHEIAIFDDTGGWAKGALDILGSAQHPTMAVQFHGKATDPRYKNIRAEMWLLMAEWVRRGGALPPIPELVAELTVPTYSYIKGQLQLEAKDQIKERLGRSPDIADGLALTFAIPEAPAASMQPGIGFGEPGKTKHEYDPHRDREDDERVSARHEWDPHMVSA